MNNLREFTFKSYPVRTAIKDGEPWFVAVDVCNIIGLGQVSRAMDRLDEDERGLVKVTHPQAPDKELEVNAVNEAGLYQLIIASNKPEAREFKRWVTHDVLPSIRKHGMYATPAKIEEFLSDPDNWIKTLQALKQERAGRIEAEKKVAVLEPKAQVLAAWTGENNKDLITIRALAKLINKPGLGQNNLFKFLRWAHVLDEYNRPMQRYIDAGYMRSVEIQGWTERDTGIYHPLYQAKVTAKGKEWITRLVFEKYEQWTKTAICASN